MTNGILVNVLNVTNKRLVRSLILTGTTALNILLTWFFIDWIGMIGAVIATAVSTLIGQVILMNIYYSKRMGISVMYLFAQAFKGLLPAEVVSGGAAFAVASVIPNTLLSFLAGGATFVILCVVLFVLFGFNDTEKAKVKSIINKFSRGKIS